MKKVWVAVIVRNNAIDILASKTRRQLYKEVYSYICECWYNVADRPGVPEVVPRNKLSAIKLYFDNHPGGEHCEIQCVEVS